MENSTNDSQKECHGSLKINYEIYEDKWDPRFQFNAEKNCFSLSTEENLLFCDFFPRDSNTFLVTCLTEVDAKDQITGMYLSHDAFSMVPKNIIKNEDFIGNMETTTMIRQEVTPIIYEKGTDEILFSDSIYALCLIILFISAVLSILLIFHGFGDRCCRNLFPRCLLNFFNRRKRFRIVENSTSKDEDAL